MGAARLAKRRATVTVWRFLLASFGGRTWTRLTYVLLSGPLCWLAFLGTYGSLLALGYLLIAAFPISGLAVVLLGPPALATALLTARAVGALHRTMASALLGVTVPRPPRPSSPPGPFGWLATTLSDSTGWRSVLYVLLKLPLGLVTPLVALLSLVVGGLGVAYPLWYRTAVHGGPDGRRPGIGFGDLHFDTWPKSLLVAGFGIVVLLAAPWLIRALLWPDILLIRVLLGPSRAARLRETRALAVDDAADRLRRIERDLHDGAQAQLVALAMKLGLAREELAGGDQAAAGALLEVAHHEAKRAIVELRDLARGIHPPALDDGLGPALRALTARGAIPVELELTLHERPAQAIESIAYFTAAELLTNVAKHSRASHATLTLHRLRADRLRLTVHDNGIGGAHPAGGLTGLADRVRTVDGTLDITSPPGGPTTVTVELPDRP